MFKVEVVGDKAVEARFARLPRALNEELSYTIYLLTYKLGGYIQQRKLQGQVLKHRTGKLSRSIEEEIFTNPDSIVGRVFANGTAPYAAIHEYGFSGEESVRSFTRKQTMVFGRPIDPIIVTVNAFTRQMNMPERSFMRSSLRENAAMIERELTNAVARAAQGQTT